MTVITRSTTPFLVKAWARVKALIVRVIERNAEARIRRIRFEMEMYGGRYRYSSKFDDDLPLVTNSKDR